MRACLFLIMYIPMGYIYSWLLRIKKEGRKEGRKERRFVERIKSFMNNIIVTSL